MNDYSSNAAFMGIFMTIFLFMIPFFILLVVSIWKVFEKAGQPGWACLIPIYNGYILTVIIGKPWWWLLLMCIPYVGIIWAVWATNLLSKSFGKTEGFTAGLLFLGFIFYPILGFSKSIRYIGPGGVPLQPTEDAINSIGAI